jgi:NAD+ kinase
VNLGDLGYLTAVEPSGCVVALERFLAGAYEVEERMRLAVTAPGLPAGTSALNEVVVEKAGSGQTVRLDVRLDDVPFTSYVADGLILATATGSTAYSFSSRGPILDPKLRAVVTTPVAAHMLFDRSMVLDADCVVTATVADDRPAELSIDGREFGTLEPGAELHCTGAERPTRLVTFGGRDFHSVLRSKLALGDR